MSDLLVIVFWLFMLPARLMRLEGLEGLAALFLFVVTVVAVTCWVASIRKQKD